MLQEVDGPVKQISSMEFIDLQINLWMSQLKSSIFSWINKYVKKGLWVISLKSSTPK